MIDEFIKEVEESAKNFSLKIEVVAKTKNAVKIKVQITENIYLQFYYNSLSGTKNYVLIGWNRRLFGRDCIGGRWHLHPFENPDEHVFCDEVPVKNFFEEVFEILIKNKLI